MSHGYASYQSPSFGAVPTSIKPEEEEEEEPLSFATVPDLSTKETTVTPTTEPASFATVPDLNPTQVDEPVPPVEREPVSFRPEEQPAVSTASTQATVALAKPQTTVMSAPPVTEGVESSLVQRQATIELANSPEGRSQARYHNAVIKEVGEKIVAFELEFNWYERMSNRLGFGWTRYRAGGLLHSIAKLTEEIANLEKTPEGAAVIGLGAQQSTLSSEDWLEQKIKGLKIQLAKAENEYMSVVDAVMNPQMTDADGKARTIRGYPLMIALQKAQAAGDTKLVNRLLSEFWVGAMAETTLPSITQAGFEQLLIPGGLGLLSRAVFGASKRFIPKLNNLSQKQIEKGLSAIKAEAKVNASVTRIGFVLGTGYVAKETESRAAFSDYLQQEGVDITDMEAVSTALRDPELVAKGRSFAMKRGYSVAMWSMLSSYLATKIIAPPGLTNKFAKQIVNGGAQLAQQIASEGLGEFQAQVVSGQEVSGLDIKLEMMGAGHQVFTEPMVFHVARKLGAKPEDMKTMGEVLQLFLENPEMTREEALVLMQEVASKGISRADAEALLQSIPGGKLLNMDTIFSDKQHTAVATKVDGFQEDDIQIAVVNDGVFVDVDGAEINGRDIIKGKDNEGKVYWSTNTWVNPGNGTNNVSATENATLGINNLIKDAQKSLDNVKAQGAPAHIIAFQEDKVLDLKERLRKHLKDEATMKPIRKRLHALLQDMVTLFMPGQDIMVIEDNAGRDTAAAPGLSGSASSTNQGGKRTQLIHLNTSEILNMTVVKDKDRKAGRGFTTMLSTMGHEFGHAIAMTWFETLPPVIREALMQEHRTWLAAQIKAKGGKTLLMDILQSKAEQTMLKDVSSGSTPGETVSPKPKTRAQADWISYSIGFTEFVADLMARQMANKDSTIVAPLTKQHLPRLQAIMRRYFDKFRGTVFPADETYTTFLTYLKATAQAAAVNEIKSQFSKTELGLPAGKQSEILMAMLKSKDLKVDPEVSDQVYADMDAYNKWMRFGFTLLQVWKENKHIPGLGKYVKTVHEAWVTKSNWNDQAMQTINAWRRLGNTGDELGRFLIELTVASDKVNRKLTNDEVQALFKEKKINFGKDPTEAWAVYDRITTDLSNSLQELYMIEKNRINKDWADMETQRSAKIIQLDKQFAELRNRNYFPLSRFGRYGITMKAQQAVTIDGKSYKKGEIVHMELYESKWQRNRGIGTLRRKYGKHVKNQFFTVSETMKSFSGLPIALMKGLKDSPKLALDKDQKIQLQEMIDTLSPIQGIAKRMLARKGTAGFSADAQRGYGNYMMMMGGHISRMRHGDQMLAGIQEIRKSADYLGSQGIINDKRYEIAEHLERHMEYMLNPVNEWAGMRSLAFIWFLGYLPKAAVVNLTQIPLVAYPYLAARAELTGGLALKSDAVAIAALGVAMKDIGLRYNKNINKLSLEEQAMLSVLQSEGITDESLATEVAGIAHGDVISRMMPAESAVGRKVQAGTQRFVRGATAMFQAAEKMNRLVVALATFRLARAKGMDTTLSTDEAREAIQVTQFEYARWNRVAFMRGKAGVLTVFMQYVQNILYFVTREPGNIRYMFMLFMAAGLQGMPGAEDLLDILDASSMKMKKHFKIEGDPYTDIRKMLRDYIEELGMSPELIMHGAAAQSFGLSIPAVSDMLGTSIAGLSFEASISMGRLVPGLEGLLKILQGRDVGQSGVVEAGKDVLGAAITIPLTILGWTADTDPSDVRAFERMAPSFLKGGARALRIINDANDEGISTYTNRSGMPIIDFDMNNPTHIAELTGMVLGAQPTRLVRAQEALWSENQAIRFYVEYRRNLQVTYNYAMDKYRNTGDYGLVDIAVEAIRRFNRGVPKGQKMIRYGKAYKNHVMEQGKQGKGARGRLMDVPLRRDYQKSFPAATEERIK